MAGIQDFQEYVDDFHGTVATFPAAADPATPWLVVDTSSSGTPTYTTGTSVASLTLAATEEVENVCLAHGDALSFDIDDLLNVEMRVRLGVAMTTGTELVFGVGSARDNTTDNVVAHAWFKMVGASSTTLVYVETDDSVRDNNDISSGATLGTSFKKFFIDFSNKKDVKFYIDGVRVAAATTFDMSGYTAGLQPMVQIQKASNTNVNSVILDYVKINARRS
jgi:hypothetical protein